MTKRTMVAPSTVGIAIEETVDGEWMVLINGFQWGGDYDRSGAGNATFPTKMDAARALLEDRGAQPTPRVVASFLRKIERATHIHRAHRI